ncbi:MAG: nuclear transport factor 2 family protein, partial [Nitrososphaeraceae archaeon]
MSKLTLPETIRHFIESANHGDKEAFLRFFSNGGVVIDSDRRFVGHDAIRQWSDREFIGAKGQITVTNVELSEDEVRVAAYWA